MLAIICCDCGDHPGLDCREIPVSGPGAQLQERER